MHQFSPVSERMQLMHRKVRDRVMRYGSEHAQITTDFVKANESMVPYLRRPMILKALCENMTVRVEDWEMIVGNNAEYFCGDASAVAQKLARDGLRPDVIITDPPRKGMDEAVLALCGLCPGDVIPWKEAAARAEARIFRAGKTEAVCGTCEWFPLCRDTGAVPKAGIIQGPEIMQTTEVIQNE